MKEMLRRSKDLTEAEEDIRDNGSRSGAASTTSRRRSSSGDSHKLKVDLPRQGRASGRTPQQVIDLKATALLPLSLKSKGLAFAKLKHDHSGSALKLADLRRIEKAMTVHAHAGDGLVYFGQAASAATGAAAAAGAEAT